MHPQFSLCILILSVCCVVESIYNEIEDELFRHASKNTPGMKDCSCFEEQQLPFIQTYFEELVLAKGKNNNISVELESNKCKELGITHVFHMALNKRIEKSVGISLLGVGGCDTMENLRFSSVRPEENVETVANLTRVAAVQVLKEYCEASKTLVNGSDVIEKASYLYDDNLWRDHNGDQDYYYQYAIVLVRKSKSLEDTTCTPKKNKVLQKVTNFFNLFSLNKAKKSHG